MVAVFLALIKERFTNAQIEWFVDERFGAILEHSPYIDKLHPIALKSTLTTFNPLKIFKLFKSLKAYEYDIVIDMQGLIKSALITQMLKAPKKSALITLRLGGFECVFLLAKSFYRL